MPIKKAKFAMAKKGKRKQLTKKVRLFSLEKSCYEKFKCC